MFNTNSSWSLPPANPTLLNDDIHIWCASLDPPLSAVQNYKQLLSEDERMRAERFYFEKDRNHFIVARGLLRTIIGQYLNIEPGRLKFCYGENGKPVLSREIDCEPINFNLSHSNGFVVYALARRQEVGIDIEFIRPISDAMQIAGSFFSARETNVLRTIPESKKYEAFFNCWTRKEAFIKAIGTGLSYPLDQFDVSLAPGEPAKMLSIKGDEREATKWFLKEFIPAPGYVAALAVEGSNWQLSFWRLSD